MREKDKLQRGTTEQVIKLNKRDREIFDALGVVVEGVAQAFGSNCEVVLHNLEDLSRSVIKIENGHVTGRKVGSPLTDFGIEVLKKANSLESDVISYYSKLGDGRLLRSVTMLIRNIQGAPIGMMCINMDLSVPLLDFLTEFLPKDGASSQGVVEHFPSTIKDLLRRTLETLMADVNCQKAVSPSEKNMLTVLGLYQRGIFKVRGAVDLVAKEMGISRYTVYNYIRQAKAKLGEEF